MTILLTLLWVLAGILSPAAVAQQPINIGFREFLAPVPTEIKPSDKLLSLQGKRIRLIGFMAEMETMPEGYFYLCSRPVYCDESGGGLGDLPIDAVRVVLRTKRQQPVTFLPQPLAVTGILELGGQSEIEQDSWAIRLLADSFEPMAQPQKTPVNKQRRKSKR